MFSCGSETAETPGTVESCVAFWIFEKEVESSLPRVQFILSSSLASSGSKYSMIGRYLNLDAASGGTRKTHHGWSDCTRQTTRSRTTVDRIAELINRGWGRIGRVWALGGKVDWEEAALVRRVAAKAHTEEKEMALRAERFSEIETH